MVSSQKRPERTSLRSAIQATDSTCSGCSANSAATQSAAPARAGEPLQDEKHRTRVATCSTRLDEVVPLRHHAEEPHVAMCESQVSGCQLRSETW